MGTMFTDATSFNQDLSQWCVKHFNTQPASFKDGTTAWTNPAYQPRWGQDCSMQMVVWPPYANNNEVSLAMNVSANSTVYWGDGDSTNVSTTGNLSHTYANSAERYIYVRGGLNTFPSVTPSTSLIKLIRWGNTGITNLSYAFANDSNLVQVPDSLPVTVTDISNIFENCIAFNDSNVSNWNVANVTNMMSVFSGASTFNQPLNNWNVANVLRFDFMFKDAALFNYPLNNWNVSSAQYMTGMFQGAQLFNQPIGNWNVSSVQYMNYMFSGCDSFNQNINTWNVASVENMTGMFSVTASFNQPLNSWNVSNVKNTDQMFANALVFNESLNNWNLASDTSSIYMFTQATSFNQNIGTWNVSNIKNMTGMFEGAIAFDNGGSNSINNWNVGNVKLMDYLFKGATSFNRPLSAWNVSKVISMGSMFAGAESFNQSINAWATDSLQGVAGLFSGAIAFNQPLNNWNMSKVNWFAGMFQDATAFNQDISNWDVDQATNMENMFNNASSFNQNLSSWCLPLISSMPTSFDDNATAWTNPNWRPDWGCDGIGSAYPADAMVLQYNVLANGSIKLFLPGTNNCTVYWGDGDSSVITTSGIFTHTYLSDFTMSDIAIVGSVSHFGKQDSVYFETQSYPCLIVKSWGNLGLQSLEGAFRDNNLLTDVPDSIPSTVTNCRRMFDNATSINDTSISYWNMSNVTNMEMMFRLATSFNQPLNTWNVSNVTTMAGLFTYCSSFNQNINSWNVGSVTDMTALFLNATSFNQPLDNWNMASVKNTSYMFSNATAFSQALNSWNVSADTSMSHMFESAVAFNQPLNNWNTSNVKDMSGMFWGTNFNQNINSWNVGSVTNMSGMFAGASAFNQPLNTWTVSNVKNMSSMFEGATSFNQSLNDWNVSAVTNMYSMFRQCAMNQPINAWNVSAVTDMGAMFADNSAFNQAIGNWNVANVTFMVGMFYNATQFNQDLTTWCVSQIASQPTNFHYQTGSASTPWPSNLMPNWGAPCTPQVPTGCSIPTSINASPTNNSVTLSFTKPLTANATQLQFRLKGNTGWGGTSSTGSSITINNLSPNTTYEYRMRSLCTGSNSSFTTISEFTTLSAPPVYTCQAPTGISATVNSNTSVTFNWTAATNGGLYFVQFKPSASTWAQAGGSSTSGTSRTFNYLTPGTTYDYRIRTTCTPGSTVTPMSIFSSIGQFTTTGSLPGMAEFVGNDVVVYPNPSHDIVNIDFVSETEEALSLFVVDVTGRRVQTIQAQALLGHNHLQISLGSLANGMYIIQSKQGDNVRTLGKVTKQ
jgi:surface protein